jgi:hypothetical protein
MKLIRSKYEEIKNKNPNSQTGSPHSRMRTHSNAASIRSDLSNHLTPAKKFNLNQATLPAKI